jgi:hypothetical protein
MDIPDIKFKHPVSNSSGIEIVEIDELYHRRLKMDHDPNAPHRVHFSLMIYIEQGEGVHFIDFSQYPYSKGSFIFISKNQIHAFSLNEKIKGKLIIFTDSFIENIQTNMNMPAFSLKHFHIAYSSVFTPSTALASSCVSLLSTIQQEVLHEDNNTLIIMLLFSSLFLMLERERPHSYTKTLTKSQVKQFNLFSALLDQGLTGKREASYYSNQLHITYKTLNNLSKLATNRTAKQLIDAYTIIEVKRRLILEDKQVQEIACDFGFEETSNFVKYFKKHTLVTPSQFKKLAKS